MLLPVVVSDINDIATFGTNRGSAVPAGVTPMLVVVGLIGPELVLKISRRPEEGAANLTGRFR